MVPSPNAGEFSGRIDLRYTCALHRPLGVTGDIARSAIGKSRHGTKTDATSSLDPHIAWRNTECHGRRGLDDHMRCEILAVERRRDDSIPYSSRGKPTVLHGSHRLRLNGPLRFTAHVASAPVGIVARRHEHGTLRSSNRCAIRAERQGT